MIDDPREFDIAIVAFFGFMAIAIVGFVVSIVKKIFGKDR